MIHGFYWLVPEALAGCPRPGGRNVPDSSQNGHADAALQTDLRWLANVGLGAILSLTETCLPDDPLTMHGFESLHIPVADMTAPSPKQLERALSFIDCQRAAGRAVAVHCKEGQGRTGTILAAYLIRSGSSSSEAVEEIRAICPGAIGSKEQETALQAFERRRDWIV